MACSVSNLIRPKNITLLLATINNATKERQRTAYVPFTFNHEFRFLYLTVSRQNVALVQTIAPEVIAKRTKRHLDELEVHLSVLDLHA
jgi:hypothetical protein